MSKARTLGFQSAGIDLAGFSTGNTCVVLAKEKNGIAYCEILDSHPFSRKRNGEDDLFLAISEEATFLKELLEKGRVVADVPIDLQSLTGIFLPASKRPEIKKGTPITDIYKRPVDKAFGGLSPVADRLAAPVIRFASSMHYLNARHPRILSLGRNLFETYPKASFEALLDGACTGYKRGPSFHLKGKLQAKHGPISSAINVLERISFTHGVSFESIKGCGITDHRIDALICALTGLKSFDNTILPKKADFPNGYRLIAHWPEQIKRVILN